MHVEKSLSKVLTLAKDSCYRENEKLHVKVDKRSHFAPRLTPGTDVKVDGLKLPPLVMERLLLHSCWVKTDSL